MAATMLAACGDSDGPTESKGTKDQMVVLPAGSIATNLTLTVGDTIRLALRDQHGVAKAARFVIDAGGVAAISEAGLLTALNPGTTTIAAVSGSNDKAVRLAEVLITVQRPLVSRLELVGPDTLFLAEGQTDLGFRLTAIGYSGEEMPLLNPTWKSENPFVAHVTPDGRIIAEHLGTTLVTASYGGAKVSGVVHVVSDSTTYKLIVNPNRIVGTEGESVPVRAVAQNRAGQKLSGVTSFRARNSNVRVDAFGDNAVVYLAHEGNSTITVRAHGETVEIPVVINRAKPTNIVITTNELNPEVDDQITLRATPYAGNLKLEGRVVTWASLTRDIATIDASTGVAKLLRPGTATFTATVDGVTMTYEVVVAARSADHMALDITETRITEGRSRLITATVYDKHGKVIPDAPVRWVTSRGAVVSVTEMGNIARLTGVGSGRAVVTAISGHMQATVNVLVTQSR